ncbi:MAG TPA: TonB family protein [Vicinamibacterales bacterium]|nr:TonB family protein [Vicinamibacterales bacterium]
MKCYLAAALIAGSLLAATPAGAQDADLSAARDLYASAAYDDALTMLNRLRSAEHPASQSRANEQYRAFCLLALGRSADAEQAIEAVVAADATFQPGETDASPRIRSAFTSVRRRMLPSIIQQKYAQAKAAFDRKEFAAAADGFTQVLTALADQDVAVEAKQPPLSDLRTLAGGFQELAAKAAAPPPPPPAPVVVAPPPPAVPAAPRIYTGGETGIVPPVVVNQSLPSFPGQVIIPRNGKLEIVIDESGSVESAVMRESVSQTYDAMVLSATRAWRYRPATANGTPVKFRKTVQITIKLTT